MFEEIAFSREAKLVYAEAADIARHASKPLDSTHLVLAIFYVPCEAQSILLEKRADCDRVLNALDGLAPEPNETVGAIYQTAAQIAGNVGSRQVTSVHLLMAISRVPSSRAARMLEKAGLPLFAIRTQAMAHLTDPRLKRAAAERLVANGNGQGVQVPAPVPMHVPAMPPPRPSLTPASAGPALAAPASSPRRSETVLDESAPVDFDADLEEEPDDAPARAAAPPRPAHPDGRYALDPADFPTLVSLGRNLTAEAEAGTLDPLIGREDALDAMVDILCKRRSNNPLLLGDPGVGKTALVEGLASLIVGAGDRLPALSGKVIVSVSVSDLVAGTEMRGAFAARLRGLKDEVLAAERRVILFIDEIHTLIGAGTGDGGMDAANDLKGALARGQFPCIGATTFAEYQRYIQTDDALDRRFEKVVVSEPSLEEAERILAGLAPRYAEHHGVTVGEDAIRAAVRLTDRVIPSRCLPDKAINAIDRAGARAARDGRDEVSREDIVKVLSAMLGLPPEFLALSPAERFRGLDAALRDRVFGHDECLAGVVHVLLQNWARFGSRRPMASLLFAGPSGVGKRTTALAVAEQVFGSPQAVLEIDLSEYGEAHSISHLIGSPPGYVGHEEGGLLVDTLTRRPFLLILWQHADLAHSSVQGLLTQILSEGTATDRKGRRMDFRNTIHVLTAGENDASGGSGRTVGFGSASEDPSGGAASREVISKLRRLLPADLFQAIDQALVFRPIDEAALRRVATRVARETADSFLDEHGVRLVVDDAVIEALARQAARGGGSGSLAALVGDLVLRPATDRVYHGPAGPGTALRVSLAGDGPGAPRTDVTLVDAG